MKTTNAILATTLAACAAFAYAQDRLPYTTPNTAGAELEQAFSDVLRDCGIDGIYKPVRVFSDIRLTSIPLELQSRVQLDASFFWSERDSVARIFSYVYTATENSISAQRNPLWILSTDTLNISEATMLPKSGSRVGYNFDCGATVAAALKANGSLELPVATMKSALTSKYSGSNHATLTLNSGTFESPILRLLDTASPPNQQIRGLMYVYDWYAHRQEQNVPYKMLSTLDGLAMFQSRQMTDSVEANVESNVDLRFPVFKINGSSSGNVTYGKGLSVDKFYVGVKIDQGRQAVGWGDLPGTQEVATRLHNFHAELDPSSDLVVQPGMKTLHRQIIAGMPPQFCNSSRWQLKPKVALTGLHLQAARPMQITEKASTEDVCEFTVAYDVPLAPAASFLLQYEFEATLLMRGKDADRPVRIPAEEITYYLSQSPELFILNFDQHFASDSGNGDISWNVGFAVHDDTASTDLTHPIRVDAKATCPAGTYPLNTPPLNYQPAGKTALLVMRFTPDPPTMAKVKDGTLKQSKCMVNATLSFTGRGGPAVRIRRDVKFELLFPEMSAPTIPSLAAGVADPQIGH